MKFYDLVVTFVNYNILKNAPTFVIYKTFGVRISFNRRQFFCAFTWSFNAIKYKMNQQTPRSRGLHLIMIFYSKNYGFTVTNTVVKVLSRLPSLTLKVKLSVPVKLAVGV